MRHFGFDYGSIKKGDTVFVASNDRRKEGQEYEATVLSVGKKYITLNTSWKPKFNKETGCMVNWSDWELFPSRDVYLSIKENNEKIRYITMKFDYTSRWKMSSEEIDQIYQIIKKYENN